MNTLYKLILRIIASPFVLVFMILPVVNQLIKNWLLFLKNGGEFSPYANDDKVTIRMIYEELKSMATEQPQSNDHRTKEKSNPSRNTPIRK